MAMMISGTIASAAPSGASIPVSGVRNFSPATYRADPQNWAIVQDDRGILYFANNSGVLEFDGTFWHLIELPGKHAATALGKSSDGRILVGGEGEIGYLAPDANGTMVYVSQASAQPQDFRAAGDRVIQILDTPNGEFYISEHWVLMSAKNGAVTSVPAYDHFMQAAWFHSALYVIDSALGLTRIDSNELQPVAGGSHIRGLAMLVSGDSLLIPSFNDGLVRYSPDDPTPWRTLNASGWSIADSAEVTSGIVVSPDLMAFGNASRGITLIDPSGRILDRIGADQGLGEDHIYNLAYDHSGGLWLALNNGVSLVDLKLPNDEGELPFHAWVRGVVGTRDDHLVFGGTYFSKPGGVQELTQSLSQQLQFPFKYNAFRFDYSANGLQATGDMEFQTYMRGVDTGWSKWSTRTEREFTQLGSGLWTFKVRSKKPDGEISTEATYDLYISPAWYDTWWFTVLQVLFVVGLVLLPGHTHQHRGLQNALTTLAVIVPFVYLGDWLSDLIGHYYSTDVAFVKTMMDVLLAFALTPLQNLVQRAVEYRNEKRREHKLKRLEALKAHSGNED
jgi:hypothetical protein